MAEQPTLAVEAAAKTGERVIGADHAMTGHNDGDRIGAIGKADGADRLRPPDLGGQCAIAQRLADRNGAQRRPDFALERCAHCHSHRDLRKRLKVAGEIGVERKTDSAGAGVVGGEGRARAIGAFQPLQEALFVFVPMQRV